MNPDPSKLHLRSQQALELASISHTSTGPAVREFGSVEEVIRADRAATQPPESIAKRLNESVRLEPKPPKSWWHRLFTRSRGG